MRYDVKDIPMDYVVEHFAYDESSPTGLIWIKRPYKTNRVVGTKAGSILNLSKSGKGKDYWQISIKDKVYKVHRIVWALKYGKPDVNLVIDHIDGNGLNNKIENLRLVTNSENGINRLLNKDRLLSLPRIEDLGEVFLSRFSHKGKNYKLRVRKENYNSDELAINALLDKILECKSNSLNRELNIDKISIVLTEDIKLSIYNRVKSGETQASIAREYDIGSSTVNRIIKKYNKMEGEYHS